MKRLQFDIDCPNCHIKIHVPFTEELKAQAIKDSNMTELSAQDDLFNLMSWLSRASLITLLKFWFRRNND